MTTIVTRSTKGYPLTHNEVDANFTNLNQNKVEVSDFNAALALKVNATGGSLTSPTITGGSINNAPIGQTTPAAVKGTTGVFTSGIDSTAIGQTTPAAGKFTAASVSQSSGPALRVDYSDTTGFSSIPFYNAGSYVGGVASFGSASNVNYGYLNGGLRIDGIGGITFLTGSALDKSTTLDASGNLLVGVTSGSWNKITKNVALDAGAVVLEVAKSGSSTTAAFYGVTNGGWNSANTAMVVGTDLVTGRSINAGGTINASGADYAEYMRKAPGCGDIAKGQIVGVNADGLLTDKWSDSVSFVVKSTDPSYVGGDVWGSEDALGTSRPVEPQFIAPEYKGTAHPGEAPKQRTKEASHASLFSGRTIHVNQEIDDLGELAYALDMEQYKEDFAKWDSARAQYEIDQAAWRKKVEVAQQIFETATYPTYQKMLATFNGALERERQKVDRIAFAGQVPVNVLDAKPGKYIVPMQDGDGIKGVAVAKDDITLQQYMRAVGIVQNILPDGRANIRVKVC